MILGQNSKTMLLSGVLQRQILISQDIMEFTDLTQDSIQTCKQQTSCAKKSHWEQMIRQQVGTLIINHEAGR